MIAVLDIFMQVKIFINLLSLKVLKVFYKVQNQVKVKELLLALQSYTMETNKKLANMVFNDNQYFVEGTVPNCVCICLEYFAKGTVTNYVCIF